MPLCLHGDPEPAVEEQHHPTAAPGLTIANCGKNDSGVLLGLCRAFPDATSTQWLMLLWCKHGQI